MKKIYNTPFIDVIIYSDEIILGNNSVKINGYNGDLEYSLENGGGVGEGTDVVPGAKESNHFFWDDDEG